MTKRNALREPFGSLLIREFLATEEEQDDDLRPIGNREFYSTLAMLVASIAVLALTIGPFAIR